MDFLEGAVERFSGHEVLAYYMGRGGMKLSREGFTLSSGGRDCWSDLGRGRSY